VRELSPGVGRRQAPAAVFEQSDQNELAEPSEQEHGSGPFESPAPAGVVTPASPAASAAVVPLRYRVEFTASQEHVDLLEEARNLLQHQVPNRDIARIHELAMAVFVEQLRKRRQAASDRPRRSVPSSGPAPERVDETPVHDEPAPEQRNVPAAIRRAVWRRDAGRCTFTDSSGRRCCERAGLEIHHEHAFALGGASTIANLRLLCRAHNTLLAERDLGRAHIERKRKGRLYVPADDL
jgi:5-methylcytosine-specific restriction endonuclease McrA